MKGVELRVLAQGLFTLLQMTLLSQRLFSNFTTHALWDVFRLLEEGTICDHIIAEI